MYDVIIIGAGPSGMGTALNLLRTGRKVLLLEKDSFGGQMATSPRLENIPGIKEISGLEYTDQIVSQIMDLGVEFDLDEVVNIKKEDKKFIVTTKTTTHECLAIVLANGCSHRKMGLPKEEEFVGKGISYCAVCDGAFYKGEEIYIIGDANSALQYALMLANSSPKVHLKALFDHLFGDKALTERINTNPKIDVEYNVSLKEFLGEDKLTGLVFENTKTHEIKTYETTNVFIAIGQIPHNEFLNGLVELNKQGFILTNEKMETNVPGIFAVGDTRDKPIRQVSTALGDASTCAYVVDRYLNTL